MGNCCSTSGAPRDVKQFQQYQQYQQQQPYQQQYQQPYQQQYQPQQPQQLYQQPQQQVSQQFLQQFPPQFPQQSQQFQQPYQQTSQPSNTYSTPPSPPLPPLPQLTQPQPSYNASVPSNNRPDTIAYSTNSVYLDNNGQNFSNATNILSQSTGDTSKKDDFGQPADDQEEAKLPGTDTLPYSSADETHEEISADQKSIKDPVTVVGSIYTETTSDSHCLNCTSKLVDKDLDGYPSEYCSDQCRKEAAGFANPVCILCKEFPQVTGSKFCGKIRCRNLPKCYLCKVKDVHKGSLWCSKTCRDKTPNWQNLTIERSSYMCLVCGIEYALKGRDFCRDECELWVKNNSPCLLKLPLNADKYKDVHNQFVAAWKHPHKQVPSIYAIWKIYCSNLMNTKYNAYRAEVEKTQQLDGKPFPKGDGRRTMSAGNEQRRFHGTKMGCRVGIQSSKVCNDKQCSVCCIIKEGYKLKYVGTGTISAAFQRFGSGIYFSGTSSKSDDYNEGSLIHYMGSNYKMMLLNKVVVGKGYALTRDAMTLTSPPDGYDSVLGEPSSTGNLNYDEVVVYNESASIPQYLIVYKTV